MPSLILHSYRRCPFAIRVRMVLEEKAAVYEVREESLREPSADLLRLHPEGRVPLLRHFDGKEEFVVYESAVITEYLDELLPGARLTPSEPAAKARMRLWTYWSQTLFKADLDAFKYHRPSDPVADVALVARLRSHLAQLESAVAPGFLLGAEFSLADVHVFPLVRQLSKTAAVDLFPAAVSAWLENIMARPSFLRAMEKR